MAGSATPSPTEPEAGAELRSAGSSPRRDTPVVAVACSGGRDSIALLHATIVAARSLGLRVVALHIHHGLSAHADAWLAQLRAQVEDWGGQGWPVELRHERLSGAPAPGESVEAWARDGRHAALQRLSVEVGADLLLLGHHRRDQAETFLLQALRGAGPAGLAAMPRDQWRDGVRWARPWLDRSREAVEAYVDAHSLRFVDDDSNTDERFARNRLRRRVWPALADQVDGGAAGVEAALAQSAAWAQQALDLQREVAEADLAIWTIDHGFSQAALSTLTPARAANALREWLRRRAGHAAPATLVRRLMAEAPGAVAATWPFGDHTLRLYRGVLRVEPGASQRAVAPTASVVDLRGLDRLALPGWGGALVLHPVESGGVSASRLNNAQLRLREGGERFQRHAAGPPRALKKCWQTAAIPVPQREGPLLWLDGRLVFVPGLGVDAREVAAPGEAQMGLRWAPDAC